LLEIVFLATEEGNVTSETVTAWFSLLRDTLFFSNQRNVFVLTSASNGRCVWIQNHWQRQCKSYKHSPQSSQSDSLPFPTPIYVSSFKTYLNSRIPRQRQVTFLLKSGYDNPDPIDVKVSCSRNRITRPGRTELGSYYASIILFIDR